LEILEIAAMTKEAFKERERALEEEFFHRVDTKLLANLKAKLAAEADRQQLAVATGFTDEKLLDELVEIGVSAEAIAAMSLVPLVLVAWADGNLDSKERPLILKAAQAEGIAEATPAGQLLRHWLDTQPEPQLATTWKHYTQIVAQKMSYKARTSLCKDVVRRAQTVAKASGGSLGFNMISLSEQRVIAELKEAFDC
jgi:tellurite resistance protein